jgi:hypothetical protein
LNENLFLVSPDRVSLGCLKDNDRVHQYMIPEKYKNWQECREECNNRRMKVDSFIFPLNLCISFVFDRLLFILQLMVNVDVFKAVMN